MKIIQQNLTEENTEIGSLPANQESLAADLLAILHRGGKYAYYWTTEGRQSIWYEVDDVYLPVPAGWKNVYFGVHPTAAPGTKYERSKNESIAAVNCLFAEWDAKDFGGDKGKALTHITVYLTIPPNVLIDSGGGYHGYWLLNKPFLIQTDQDRARIDALQKAWVQLTGGDNGAKDLARVLRVPGTFNHKYDPPRLVHIIPQFYRPDMDFSIEELEAVVDLSKPAVNSMPAVADPHAVITQNTNGKTPQDKAAHWLNFYLPQAFIGNRNETGVKLARQLRDTAKITESEAKAVPYPEQVPQGSGEPYTRRDWEATVKSIYRLPPGEEARSAGWVDRPDNHAHGDLEQPPEPEKAKAQAKEQDGEKRRILAAEYVAVLKGLGYTFRMLELDRSIEVNGIKLEDALEAKIRAQLRDIGYEKVNVAHDAYIAFAYDNRYHPIKNYLESLTWDDQDHIAKLAGYFVDEDEVFPLYLRKWLIGNVARVYREGEQNRVLVLDGAQDLGKSFFVRWLVPPELQKYYVESPVQPDEKDHIVRLTNTWLWEVAELGATTRRADLEALKFFLTLQWVTVRVPYGKYDIHRPALTSFIATVNGDGSGFLHDPTGNRRYMACTLKFIAWDYAKEVDINQLWAQAKALYDRGEDWRLTGNEYEQAAEINKRYERASAIDLYLDECIEVDQDGAPTSREILDYLKLMGVKGGDDQLYKEIAQYMKTNYGIEQKVYRVKEGKYKGKSLRVYQGVKLTKLINMDDTPGL